MKRAAVILAIGLSLPLFACNQQQPAQTPAAGKGAALRVACQKDIETLCAGQQKFRRCLRQNSDKLSEGCKAAMEARKAAKQGRKKDKAQTPADGE
jgi:hypothetical protein